VNSPATAIAQRSEKRTGTRTAEATGRPARRAGRNRERNTARRAEASNARCPEERMTRAADTPPSGSTRASMTTRPSCPRRMARGGYSGAIGDNGSAEVAPAGADRTGEGRCASTGWLDSGWVGGGVGGFCRDTGAGRTGLARGAGAGTGGGEAGGAARLTGGAARSCSGGP
jgi:hypothetical protein